jgi:hypothetical protein
MADIKTKEKMVTIKLPRTKNGEASLWVSVNDRNWQIVRGVPVQVPECVAELFENQEKMQDIASSFDAEHIK